MKTTKYFWQSILLTILSMLTIVFFSNCYANYAPKPQIDNCISLSNGKLIVPDAATVTISAMCSTEPCYQIPTGFMCQTYSVVPKSSSTACTIIPPEPPAGTPTEPLPPPIPMCDSVICGPGQVRTATDVLVTCSWDALEENATKKSAYDAQKASAESTSAVYQESQLYNNLQDYCLYTTGLACPAMPPATYNATMNNFSYMTGKPPAEIKKLMDKKVKK